MTFREARNKQFFASSMRGRLDMDHAFKTQCRVAMTVAILPRQWFLTPPTPRNTATVTQTFTPTPVLGTLQPHFLPKVLNWSIEKSAARGACPSCLSLSALGSDIRTIAHYLPDVPIEPGCGQCSLFILFQPNLQYLRRLRLLLPTGLPSTIARQRPGFASDGRY
jgi:hypothetical protein